MHRPFIVVPHAGPALLRRYKAAKRMRVLTLVGYSGAGYEDEPAMLARARALLGSHAPARWLLCIGATAEGIGAVYPLAKQLGFGTLGIVSSQAGASGAAFSDAVDTVFVVDDAQWGGRRPDGHGLSPTSRTMVAACDTMVGIGGGDVARDELLAARRAGKRVIGWPAEMAHAPAIDKARRQGLPEPADFGGSAWPGLHRPPESD